MLASDLIIDALEEIRIVTAGDTLVTADGAKGLAVLNRFVDGSNIHRGNIFTERIDSLTLQVGQQTYTIGIDPAAVLTPTFALPRPVRLSRCNLLLPGGSTTVRRKINLLTKEQWSRKAVQNIAGLPIDLYNDMADPLSTYWIYQIPDQAYVIETYSWQQFAPIAALSTVLQFPQGYQEYWTMGLALRLAAAYGVTPSETTIKFFQEARENVMALNALTPTLRCDTDTSASDGEGWYNYLSGESE